VVERILATVGLAITGLAAAVFVRRPDSRALTLFVVLIMISLVLLGLICSDVLTKRAEPAKGRRLFPFLRGMAVHGKTLRQQPGQLIKAGILSVAFQLTVVAVNFCIFQALNITGLTGWDLIYVIPVISVAAMLPLGINGYGIREGAYVVLLGLYNVSNKPQGKRRAFRSIVHYNSS
jgi:signal transduction histidine kinase